MIIQKYKNNIIYQYSKQVVRWLLYKQQISCKKFVLYTKFMQFFCSHTNNLQHSITSRARTSHSKKGIQVTLYKQKQNPLQILHHSHQPSSLALSLNSLNTHQHHPNPNRPFNSNPTQSLRSSQNQSLQSDLISSYFQKAHQKQSIKKESALLDEQIKKLQMQIYNTRTKITQAKYMAKKQSQTKFIDNSKNSRKSKDKIKNDQVQTKSNKSLKYQNNQQPYTKTHQKRVVDHFFSSQNQIRQKARAHVSVNYSISPNKFMRSQQRSRSPSPPHPLVLRQMVSSTKKSNSKNHHNYQSNTEFYYNDISLTDHPSHHFYDNNSRDLTYVNVHNQKHLQSKNNADILGLSSISALERNLKIHKNQANPRLKKSKCQKAEKKLQTKKRSKSTYSRNLETYNMGKRNKRQQKLLNQSSQRFTAKRKKPNVPDFNINLGIHLNSLAKTKNIHSLILNSKTKKEKKGEKTQKQMFSNELLTKAYNIESNNKARVKRIQDQKKHKEKSKKSMKKYDILVHQEDKQKLLLNRICQTNNIHQMVNNSSHHSTIKSKYIKSRSPFY